MSDFPKYQYSLFVGTKGQVVVRTDDKEEFGKLVQEVNYTYNAEHAQPRVVPANIVQPTTTPPSLCPTHNVLYDKSGIIKTGPRTGQPWAGHKLPDGGMCWKK